MRKGREWWVEKWRKEQEKGREDEQMLEIKKKVF